MEGGDAGVAFADGGVELLGDQAKARRLPRCRVGAGSYPLDLCEGERLRPGLLRAALR